jgi:hypothetical protein
VIDRGEQVLVDVLDLHTHGLQAHFDFAAFVRSLPFAVCVREPDNYPSDSIGEAGQRQAQTTLHVRPQHLTYLDVGLPNVNPDHPAAPSLSRLLSVAPLSAPDDSAAIDAKTPPSAT